MSATTAPRRKIIFLRATSPRKNSSKPRLATSCAGKHLHRAGERGQNYGAAAFASGALRQPHDPRHPAQPGDGRRPDEAAQHDAVERKRDAREGRRPAILHPRLRQQKHSQAAPKQMQQAENSQRPRQWKYQVKQRRRIQHLRIPLRQKRRAAIA
jgi:hypothetical protein